MFSFSSRIVRTKAEKCSNVKSNSFKIDVKSSEDLHEENSFRNSSDEMPFHSHSHSHLSFQQSNSPTSTSNHWTNSSSVPPTMRTTTSSTNPPSGHYSTDWNSLLNDQEIYGKDPRNSFSRLIGKKRNVFILKTILVDLILITVSEEIARILENFFHQNPFAYLLIISVDMISSKIFFAFRYSSRSDFNFCSIWIDAFEQKKEQCRTYRYSSSSSTKKKIKWFLEIHGHNRSC